MNESKNRILLVDDCPDDIHVLMENLEDYAVVAATSGVKALEFAAKNPPPDIILLDVMMPDMDGYETCRRLKDHPVTRDIDVIFVSARDTLEEKLAGYDAGCSDYLVKPVQPEELLQKVKLAINNKYIRAEAGQVAMVAISSAGEQGVVLDFMRRSFSVDSVEALADLIVEATASYGLENSVEIRCHQQTVHRSTKKPIPPIEVELFKRLRDRDRIMTFSKRAIFNFGPVSLLIKNMPDDEEKCGRLRDHLAILLEAAQARLGSLELDQALTQLVTDSEQTLNEIQTNQRAHKEAALHIMDDTMKALEASFLSYGLTEEQEVYLTTIVQDGIDHSLNNFEQGLKADKQMRELFDRLMQIAKR